MFLYCTVVLYFCAALCCIVLLCCIVVLYCCIILLFCIVFVLLFCIVVLYCCIVLFLLYCCIYCFCCIVLLCRIVALYCCAVLKTILLIAASYFLCIVLLCCIEDDPSDCRLLLPVLGSLRHGGAAQVERGQRGALYRHGGLGPALLVRGPQPAYLWLHEPGHQVCQGNRRDRPFLLYFYIYKQLKNKQYIYI